MGRMKQPVFKLPNDLICDGKLSGSARRLAVVLYSHRNALGVCHKTVKELAALSHMAEGTVKQAAKLLEERGYIARRQTQYYSAQLQTVVNGCMEYHLNLSFREGFTLIPRSVIDLRISKSTFSVLLYLYRCAGNRNRSYPSISEIVHGIGVMRSTVCKALQELKELSTLLVRRCLKRNGAFGASSYIFTHVIPREDPACGESVTECPAASQPAVAASQTPHKRLWQRVVSALSRLPNLVLHKIPFFRSRGSPIFDPRC